MGATTGRITVTTPYGKATSVNDFYVPPTGYAATDLIVAGRIQTDGANLTPNISVAGKGAMLSFDGIKDQQLGLGIGPLTCTPATGVAFTV